MDRIAQHVITAGGITVIVCVIGILLLIAKEAVPLFRSPDLSQRMKVAARPGPAGDILGVGVGEYLENGYVLTSAGRYEVFSLDGGTTSDTIAIDPPPGARAIARVDAPGDDTFTLLWDNGAVTLERIRFAPQFDGDGVRAIAHTADRPLAIGPVPGHVRVAAKARAPADAAAACVALLESGVLAIVQHTREEDFLGNETVETHETAVSLPTGADLGAFTLSEDGASLYVGTTDGRLFGWDLSRPGAAVLRDEVRVNDDGRAVTALGVVFGGESIGIADAGGRYTVWSRLTLVEGRGAKGLGRIHTLTPPNEAIVDILASRRDKSLLAVTASGRLRMDHATSERRLFELAPEPGLVHVAMSRRGNGFIGSDDRGAIRVWDLHNPHPEVSVKVLFGKVWYEGYKQPEYMWQSSSASDDFEPKLSLVPLVFGSIKGTLYAMVFAVPLALFGALYTSQLTRPAIRDVIKPVVEVMAAIPSVIIGFLAALWLAPLFERNLGAVFLSLIVLPAAILFAILLWQVFRRWRPLQVVENGYEFLIAIPVLVAGVALAGWVGPWMETVFFGGDLKAWMFQEAGIRYDPRNCIVIAFALGFAVIPIIFTMAEDAFSNVPRSLTAASLAMGASRWQTVWRVVLPSASPGIFAGIVIGLGRAVGETMIVLMATGNTPLLDWSPFNGMRTLSANIAVEVPEAPFGGTLYRVLFLSAVVLFLMTFALNTLAELIRQRLRRKYAQFQ